jgi:hypothetical protein
MLASLGLDPSLLADPIVDDDDDDNDDDDADGDNDDDDDLMDEEELKAQLNETKKPKVVEKNEPKSTPKQAQPTTPTTKQVPTTTTTTKQTPTTTSSKPTTQPVPTTTPATMTATTSARIEALNLLRTTLNEQIEALTATALAHKQAGARAAAIDALRERRTLSDADAYAVRALADPALALPAWRWVEQVERSVVVNKEIFDNQLEIEYDYFGFRVGCTFFDCNTHRYRLIGASGIRPPSGYTTLDTYIYTELPFPDSERPQKLTAKPAVSKSLAPRYARKLYATIERKRSFAKFCERRKVYFEIWHARLLKDLLVGKVEVRLNDLVGKCSSHQVAPIRDAQGRKTAGTLEFVLRLKRPLAGDEVVETRQRQLVVELPPEPAALLATQVAAVEQKIDNVQTAAAAAASSTSKSSNNNNNNKPTSKPTAAAADDADELTTIINPAELVSFEVLTYEMTQLAQMMKADPKNHGALLFLV